MSKQPPITRRDLPWSPELARWDRDAAYNTHAERIFWAESCGVEPRTEALEGSRKIAWMSVLDVTCPVCHAGKNVKCAIYVIGPKLAKLLADFDAGKMSERCFSEHLAQGWSR